MHLFSSASARSPSCAEGAWGQNRGQALPDLPGSRPTFRRFVRAISGTGEAPKRRAFQEPAEGSPSQPRRRRGRPALKFLRSLPGLLSDRVRASDYTFPTLRGHITFPLPSQCGVSHNAAVRTSQAPAWLNCSPGSLHENPRSMRRDVGAGAAPPLHLYGGVHTTY